jgi:hypothetical protein
MVMTPDGPMSMCLHNANRDLNITKAFKVGTNGEEKTFNPVREPKREYWTKKLAAFQGKKTGGARAKRFGDNMFNGVNQCKKSEEVPR